MTGQSGKSNGGEGALRERLAGGVLILCAIVVGGWILLAWAAERPYAALDLNAGSFAGFNPASGGARFKRIAVGDDPQEPNVLVYQLRPGDRGAPGQEAEPVLVRLVHGYNMPDCMRIKGYKVEPMAGRTGPREMNGGAGSATNAAWQLWKVVSGNNQTSVWVTSMLRVDDFAYTGIDVRSMAFPRVDVPDDPGLVINGFEFSDLWHPVETGSKFIRSKWNSSRCDLLTFLRLRQPAWVDNRLLTLVTAWDGGSLKPGEEDRAADRVLQVHRAFHDDLVKWRKTGPGSVKH
ncbi:MAG: hypothetical protein C0404_12990 [Verrucomicrobia bacterium]|nr:hypothetical protein [Verrucomicrobiota bacterium]